MDVVVVALGRMNLRWNSTDASFASKKNKTEKQN
jgi:hypothetical protein